MLQNGDNIHVYVHVVYTRYVHQKDWDSAQRVAENYAPDSVSDVLVGQVSIIHILCMCGQ